MICPDWVELTAHRFDRFSEQPLEWEEAVVHLEECRTCRRAALKVDPTLVFRRSSTVETTDVESILMGVQVLRRASRARQDNPWRHAIAAAVLATIALWVAPSRTSLQLPPNSESVATSPYVENLPVVEAIDRPEARIYQFADDELSMVLIVDETLDV